MSQIKEYDVVALIENVQVIHKETKQPMLLQTGQVGTVVMAFDREAFLIDFSDSKGTTYAMETLPANKLMHLIYEPTVVYAE